MSQRDHFNHGLHCGENDMKVYILDFIFEHPDTRRAFLGPPSNLTGYVGLKVSPPWD